MRQDRILRIYTDGACAGNQNEENTGGWGAILRFGDHTKEIFGGEKNTTNNRMEMTALLEAFKAIKKEGQIIEVFSDSGYLMDCFRKKWYLNWEKNGWKTSKKTPVENKELWQQLISYLDKHTISFYRVKGHVNLDSDKTDRDKLYEKFIQWNGRGFSPEDFRYITEMNNRADELANMGIEQAGNSD
ncbi:MAG TPA: ribonuclease HI [Candidatus Copromorpha excrementigallinarum]|uniref:ribonuclease H n=1 Tax=Candidatus Allocopromorpha excrementigallinarum TaxID=2840742 RepID=A0A9D1I059_9FIRM|nr:ribonuclease HI [Candidatus Copromorpha excrementigallinarum]